jgi:hypothetical protein
VRSGNGGGGGLAGARERARHTRGLVAFYRWLALPYGIPVHAKGGGSGRGQQRRTAARAVRAGGGAGPGLTQTATQHVACGDFKASQRDPVLEVRGLGKARELRMRSGGPGCRGQARPEHQGAGRPEILQSTPVSPRFSSKI